MNSIEMLHRQTQDAYTWFRRLVNSVPRQKWDITPEVIETNITWQVGHLLMSYYYHSIMCISGHLPEIRNNVPLREYAPLFTYDAVPREAVGKVSLDTLMEHLQWVEKSSLAVIEALAPEALDEPLAPTRIPNPIAKTQYEVLDWNIKHTMWHCGQTASLKRILGDPHDFGLQKAP